MGSTLTGPPVQVFQDPKGAFPTSLQRPRELGNYGRHRSVLQTMIRKKQLITRALAECTHPKTSLPRCFSNPSFYPAANHCSSYRRAQPRPRGTALFLIQCFKLRAELVRPIRKRSLKEPIRKREGAEPTGRPFAFNVGPGYQLSLPSCSLWDLSHLILNLDVSCLRLQLRTLVFYQLKRNLSLEGLRF